MWWLCIIIMITIVVAATRPGPTEDFFFLSQNWRKIMRQYWEFLSSEAKRIDFVIQILSVLIYCYIFEYITFLKNIILLSQQKNGIYILIPSG